ncbi:MAG TPA: DUF948 domain-containing protein [Candidatus Polarisedimenticolia bacterium]|nr:DUF948 domain-containing protein [Candidatus Polarisedimenticolia bacterium]
MTAWIFALAAIGFVVVLAVLSYHVIITLRQARQTARAAEQFLLITRPKVEDTISEVNRILGHANHMLLQAEEADGGRMAGLVHGVRKAVTMIKAGMQAFRLVQSLKSEVSETWKDRNEATGPREVRYATGGRQS